MSKLIYFYCTFFTTGAQVEKRDKSEPPSFQTVTFFLYLISGYDVIKSVANAEYWKNKLQKNVINDRIHSEQLQQMGWMVIYLWECELKKDFIGVMDAVIKVMQGTVN